jgi:hypothetical protein
LLTVAAGMTACDTTMQSLSSKTTQQQKSNVRISVTPDGASIMSGSQLQLSALVQDTSNTAVSWSASAGTISRSGLYSAPSVQGAQTVMVVATSVASPSSHASTTISVTPKVALTIAAQQLPNAFSGLSYSAALSAAGGVAPYQWSISSGVLPHGLQFNRSGVISGSATQIGTFQFTVGLKDTAAAQAAHAFSLTVWPNSTGNFDGPAELPRVYLHTALADTPAAGKTIQVNAGGNLQSALNSASCGDTIELQAGTTFSGTFKLPQKNCDDSHWIILRTGTPDSELPPEGTRITPCYAGVASLPGRPDFHCALPHNALAKIAFVGTGGSGPISFAAGANHYRVLGLEITRVTSDASVSNLASPENRSPADHIIFDRVWMHGTAQSETTRGLYLAGTTYISVIDSYFSDFHCVAITGACSDAQAIGGGLGDIAGGPYKIVNNFLEASGQSILFGGGGATTTPADIEIRHNHMYKPMIWKPDQPGFVGGISGKPFIVKNLFELKNAERVLFEGNILENVWSGFSQQGFAILITPKNPNTCPTCKVQDITLRYNWVAHMGGAMQIANVASDTGALATAGERYSIHDLLFDDIDQGKYGGFGMLAMIISNAPKLRDVWLDHITAFPSRTLLNIGGRAGETKIAGFVFRNSIVGAGESQITSTGGGATNCASLQPQASAIVANCFQDPNFTNNVIVGAQGPWPSHNSSPGRYSDVGFVNFNNGNGGDYHLCQGPKQPDSCKGRSKYLKAGTDGKDPGANIDAIEAAIAGVR